MSVSFSTKARILEELLPLVKHSHIEPQVRFNSEEWLKDSQKCLDEIYEAFKGTPVIVRSSAINEDTTSSSKAGAFVSVLNVDSGNPEALKTAVQQVDGSFDDKNSANEIFVQKFATDVRISGVVFTKDMDTLAPYYVINYDDQSRRTDTVTSGSTTSLKTLILFREAASLDPSIAAIIKAIQELESLLNNTALDVEFALDKNGRVTIFQVRPIVVEESTLETQVDTSTLGTYLGKIKKKIHKLSQPHPYIFGEESYFGVMPDWNPAEIIRVRPRCLALSLYKELVTDRVWAYQRSNYGYKDVRSFPLLVSFLGIPYIDIRASFNSFIPQDLSDSTAEKLVQYYLRKIKKLPELHDKIEFEIVLSCGFLNLSAKLKELEAEGLSRSEIGEIEDSLLHLTNRIIDPNHGYFEKDLLKCRELQKRIDKIKNSNLPLIDRIYWLLEDCKRYGTLPFAGVARSAFVAMQLLRSFVDTTLINQNELDGFLVSLSTISKQMQLDFNRVNSGEMTRENFLNIYGHLRPGTYDILSKRYDEDFDHYFSSSSNHEMPDHPKAFEFPAETMTKLDEILSEKGFQVSAKELLHFIVTSIEGREESKFIFTKSLSLVLVLLQELCEKYGVDRESASHLNIQTLTGLYGCLDHRDLKDILEIDIAKNRHYHQITQAIKLPHLILKPEDIMEFHLPAGTPSFVTMKSVEADVIVEGISDVDLKGKIVFIPSADPGYDWVFSKNPAALVTMYGGANSHMTVRCAELGLPAIIGAGEQRFNNWRKASRLFIDCSNQHVSIVY